MKMEYKVKTEEEKIKEKTTLLRNCLKAGLTHIADDIYADEDVYPTQYYRFGFVRSVRRWCALTIGLISRPLM